MPTITDVIRIAAAVPVLKDVGLPIRGDRNQIQVLRVLSQEDNLNWRISIFLYQIVCCIRWDLRLLGI